VSRAWVLAAVIALAAGCSRANALGDLRYFRGATVVGSTSSSGEAFGFPSARWEQIELRSQAPYEQVRDFYAHLDVRGWTSTFENESSKSTGRVYWRYLADNARQVFYVVMVEERQPSKDVSIILRRGLAKPKG
jgi:hypothetical protein